MSDTPDGLFIKPIAATYSNGLDQDYTQNKNGISIAESFTDDGYGLADVTIQWK